MIGRALEGSRHLILTASDGAKALELLRENSVDVLMTDVFMPVMDGLELIQAVRSEGWKLPIIALSGALPGPAGADFLRYAQQFGADYALPKPFRVEQLRAVLAACLGTTRTP